MGRYRVKFDFDLKTWRSGEESLWVRLAKPYAGDTYGFHFPLIDGTEVAIAFTDGNPDRPYIAHAMHDSTHPDHVTTANKHRNVIRTPANNKLRMDDKRGEGFELRTDEWGAIRAGKGLYVTTEEQYQAGDLQLQMDSAVKELQQASHMVKQLNELAQAAQAELADLQSQKHLLEQSLNALKQPTILNYAPAGIADVTPSSIQQTAGDNIIQTAQSSVDISAFKRFMVNAGNMISLFASKMGIKIFASKGNIDIQAQNDQMLLSSKQDMKITSTDSEALISGKKKVTLVCDGTAVVLEPGCSIKFYAPGDIKVFSNSFGVLGPQCYNVSPIDVPATFTEQDKQEGITLYLETEDGYPIPTTKYIVRFANGELRQGRLDSEGKVVLKNAPTDMEYAYTYPDTDDILAKANAQRLHKAIETGNADEIVDYLSLSKEIVAKTQHVYQEIYRQNLLQSLDSSIGPYNNKKVVIDYLLAKAGVKK